MAKCTDLQIPASKQQVVRFFDIFERNNEKFKKRTLFLSDMGLGDQCMIVLDRIIQNNSNFAQLDISKNQISNAGLKSLGLCLKQGNCPLVHINLGGNNV
jgi:hypothetical protein